MTVPKVNILDINIEQYMYKYNIQSVTRNWSLLRSDPH